MGYQTDHGAEDIEFVTIAQGEFDGPKAAKEEVIRTQDAYTAFFEGSPPNTPDVNWDEEEVLAVSLGERRSGGYSVEITKIIPETIGIMGGTAWVHYVETVASGATHDALTYPYHAVKCEQNPYRYIFRKETDG
jgi:hypothetical protein